MAAVNHFFLDFLAGLFTIPPNTFINQTEEKSSELDNGSLSRELFVEYFMVGRVGTTLELG